MKILMLLLIVLTLGACASQPERSPPDWGSAAIDTTTVTDPAELPLICPIKVLTTSTGERVGTWSAGCWSVFEAFEIVAEANTEIAQANANALRNTEAGYNSLVKAGEMQQELTEFNGELLKEERQEHWLDNMIYRVIIALGLVAVAL